MSCSLISVFAIMCNLSVSNTMDSDFKLPKTWTKDFTISLSHSGGRGGSTQITFTHDSCKYLRNSGTEAPKESFFLLTESDRAEILKKMHELKVDEIRSETSIAAVDDGWSTSMCFDQYCIEGGTSAKMSVQDKNHF